MTRVDLVLDALGIEVVRRRGTRAWVFCIFHEGDAKAPTFFVRLAGDKAGTIFCFSCKKRGNLVDLTERVRRCTREEAIGFVRAAGEGYEPPRARVRVVERPPMLARRRFAMPREFIDEPLEQWVSGASGYLRRRGLGEREVEEYKIGYAVDGKLAGRIVFPSLAHDTHAPAGYSARSFVDAEPKYKTPDEDEGADRDVMFGEHLWPRLGDRGAVVVTEGSVDAASARIASGLPCAALGGSEVPLVTGQVLSLATFEIVIVMTDADAPGDRVARAIAGVLGRAARVRRLRTEEDANAILRRDPARLREEILRAAGRNAS